MKKTASGCNERDGLQRTAVRQVLVRVVVRVVVRVRWYSTGSMRG